MFTNPYIQCVECIIKCYILLRVFCIFTMCSVPRLFQIFYYSANLFKEAGLEETVAMHATSGVGAIMVVMTLVTLPLMDRVGRRTLHLIGLGGMFIFSILITVCLTLKVNRSLCLFVG